MSITVYITSTLGDSKIDLIVSKLSVFEID